jgi:hypothetical protein
MRMPPVIPPDEEKEGDKIRGYERLMGMEFVRQDVLVLSIKQDI